MDKLKVEQWPIDKLVEYVRNPRKNDEQVPRMVAAIKEFGFRIPIVAKSDGTVVDGHLRLKAARKLGMETVPVALADELTDTQVKAFRLLANQSANWAEWDTELLSLEVDDLKNAGFNVDLIGFDQELLALDDAEPAKNHLEDEEEIPDLMPQPVTVEGDIWLCGKHRLMCGDSTDAGSVALLMDGDKADCCFTDPPYGMKKEKNGVANDNKNLRELLEFNSEWIPISFDSIKGNGSWYCWGIDIPLMDIFSNILRPMIDDGKITFRNLITWDKGFGQGQTFEGFRMYPVADEKCLFVMRGVQGFNTNADHYFGGWEPIRKYLLNSRLAMGWDVPTMKKIVGHSEMSRDHWTSKSQWEMPSRDVYNRMKAEADRVRNETGNDAFLKEYNEIEKEYYGTRAYFDNTHDNMNNVWHFSITPRDERKDTGGHATPKPVALCSRAVKTSCPPSGVVLDLFGGSGSTLIACEQEGRRCYIMELTPRFVDVTVRRWQNFTGQEATLESSGETFAATARRRGVENPHV